MTGQEILEALDDIWTFGHEPTDEQRKAVSCALDILAEIQQYRAIGTVEEIKRMQKYSALAKKHDTIGKVIEACAEYEAIGTVEECREARERHKAAKPIRVGNTDGCPVCKKQFWYAVCFCFRCGQKIDWSEGKVPDSR